jgi:hypothetical protein
MVSTWWVERAGCVPAAGVSVTTTIMAMNRVTAVRTAVRIHV